MLTPHDVLNIIIAEKAAGDQNGVDLALLWLDIKFGRTLSPEDERIHYLTFGDGGECGLMDDGVKLFMLERALLDDGGDPGGEELPENIERLRAA